jgi:C4-dicarboxylate-specific signal transduction histidine kinase
MLVLFILYRNNRQKQKAKVNIEKAYSELKATQQQLIQQGKMASLGELTAGIAHEIQNPLNFVNNFSEVTLEMVEEAKEEVLQSNTNEAVAVLDTVKTNLEKIAYHGKRADRIVKNMMEHARSAGAEKQPTDINVLTDEYFKLAYHGFRAKDNLFTASLETQYDPSVGFILAHPQDIGRVLLNLFNNAFYAVDQKKKHLNGAFEPRVSISTEKKDRQIIITVKDNGIGIPESAKEKIYQPFFTTKPTGEGTGLGLSLSYDIITKGHGGNISAAGKEGEGAEFMISLPLQ